MDEASFTLLFPAGPEDEAGGRELGTTERDRTPRLKINFSLAAGHASGYEDEENSWPPSGGILHVPEGTGRLHKFRNDIRKVMPSCYAIVIGSGLRNIPRTKF